MITTMMIQCTMRIARNLYEFYNRFRLGRTITKKYMILHITAINNIHSLRYKYMTYITMITQEIIVADLRL